MRYTIAHVRRKPEDRNRRGKRKEKEVSEDHAGSEARHEAHEYSRRKELRTKTEMKGEARGRWGDNKHRWEAMGGRSALAASTLGQRESASESENEEEVG